MNNVVSLGSLAFAVLTACFSADTSAGPSGASIPITRLRAEPYSFSFVSGFDKPARLVVRDPASWQAAWLQTYRGSSPVPPPPAVDFSREMIVVVALGSHSSGGYGILIDGASEADAGAINVSVRSISPGPKCAVTAAFTEPVDIARVPRRNGRVHFVEQNEMSTCE